MNSREFEKAEIVLQNLIHDLRQPLGNIGMSAYVLSRSHPAVDGPTREHILVVERQIEHASSVMREALAEMQRLRDQSLELTKSATAGVT
jgi:signal transduction histidine kinase